MGIDVGSFSLGSALGIAVGSLITHLLAKSRGQDDRQIAAYNSAAKTFRDSFNPIIEQYGNGIDQISHQVINNFDKQVVPRIGLESFLSQREKRALEGIWTRYSDFNDKFYSGRYEVEKHVFLAQFRSLVEEFLVLARHK